VDLRLTKQQCQRLGVSLAIGCGREHSEVKASCPVAVNLH
jgi:hypothetical protein